MAREHLQVIEFTYRHMPPSNRMAKVTSDVEGEDVAEGIQCLIKENQRFHKILQENDAD